MKCLRKVALSVLMGITCANAQAASNAEVMHTLHQWIIEHVNYIYGFEKGHNIIKNGKYYGICRIQMQSKPYSQTMNAPHVFVQTFDAKEFQVRSSSFLFPANPQDQNCTLTTSKSGYEESIAVQCQWRECETHGCTDESSRAKLTWSKWNESSESITFEVNGMPCRVEYEWPEVPS
jgi:hypothetical protein